MNQGFVDELSEKIYRIGIFFPACKSKNQDFTYSRRPQLQENRFAQYKQKPDLDLAVRGSPDKYFLTIFFSFLYWVLTLYITFLQPKEYSQTTNFPI